MPKINAFSPTVLLSIFLMGIIIMMILPMPAWVLDMGLVISITLAILVFTITLFIERPLDFSSFPTILLASVVLRLSLNVSSTKLIISEGHTGTQAAGNVIHGFSQFIMGGSVFLGLVVFCVLLIVNFMVITKGATRMAEVGARFALDGMPGKQMAIDSDMSAGAIDHKEAKARRELEQAETTFFGSLDGASKFVKGDAVAGLLITILNLVAGLGVGVVAHGMPLGSAFETYSILTVGDGLVSQIPAVIISIASALLLARGGAKGAADLAVFGQLGKHPAALGTVALLLAVFAIFPGMPFLPFMAGAIGLGLTAFFMKRRADAAPLHDLMVEELPEPMAEKSLGDVLELDDVHVEFAPDLVNMVLDPGTGLDARIANMRTHVASVFGVILPEIRLTDNPALDTGTYVLRIQGVEQARGILRASDILILTPGEDIQLPAGEDTSEPVYGAPARWISQRHQETAAMSGVTIVTPTEILATHLLEVVKKNFSRLLTLKSLRRLLHEMSNISDQGRAEANRKMLDELIPDKVPIDVLHSVLRLLLDEQVSIRNLPLILEATAEARGVNARPEAICEHVRQRLGFQLVAEMRRTDGTLPLVQLAPEWEDTFASYQVDADRGLDVALPPELFNRLAENMSEKLQDAAEQGVFAAVVTNTQRRRFIKTLMRAKGISNPVLSFEEIGVDARPSLIGVIAA
ncbi:flagellar biosynthesis protein FlhA [uncultured Tateyamaria sp.]|uniref:flagellar biosynthesis protein FlhA n=1 Tax=uncultured Tateyamaria sp. TaxID=455651 RepID=UPI002615808A|nr:flagellar biosynthesis protein FlhA [uncultured Tateyamaria sp.]